MNTQYLREILNNKNFRVALARESHLWFFNIYFSDYVSCPAAPFHRKFFEITEDESISMAVLVSFRGSAKSTIMTTSYPLWAIMGRQRKRLVVIVGRTQRQTKLMIDNLKRELESNPVLYKDMGPFKEQDGDLGAYTLYLPWYDAKIVAVSMEQTIRGIRHGKHRPELILLDDVEDMESVKTLEGRDKIYNWISSEVLPAGQLNTRVICIGNLLHEDSLLMRLKRKIQNKELDAVFMEIPLIDDDGNITWPGMYPNMEVVEKKRKQIVDKYAWHREFLLRIVSDKGRLVLPEWIHTYNDIKDVVKGNDYRTLVLTSIDPAISKKDDACKTAMVSFKVFNSRERLKIIVLPHPINERLTMSEIIDTAKSISKTLGKGFETALVVEEVGMQKAFIQELSRLNSPVRGFPVYGHDKRSRLNVVSHLIEDGTVIFPEKGCEELINQIVNFDTEKYHDLADAFSMGLSDIIRRDNEEELFEGVSEATASWEPDPHEIEYRKWMYNAKLDPDIW